MTYSQTFDIQVFEEDLYNDLMHNWTKPDGCKDKIKACQEELRLFDVNTLHRGAKPESSICSLADMCSNEAVEHYLAADNGWMDIAQPKSEYFPAPHIHGFLSQESTTRASRPFLTRSCQQSVFLRGRVGHPTPRHPSRREPRGPRR